MSRFPDVVRGNVVKTGDAYLHHYAGGRAVIHCVGPNMNNPGARLADGLALLQQTYRNVLAEAAKSDRKVLRLLPISAGLFSGGLVGPAETRKAIDGAAMEFVRDAPREFAKLKAKTIHLCIYGDKGRTSWELVFGARAGARAGVGGSGGAGAGGAGIGAGGRAAPRPPVPIPAAAGAAAGRAGDRGGEPDAKKRKLQLDGDNLMVTLSDEEEG